MTPSPRFWAGAVIAAFLICNLLNIHDYGLSYDEAFGMRRGEETTGLFRAALAGSKSEYTLTYATYQLYPSFYAFLNYQCAVFLKGRGLDPIASGHVLNLITATFGLAVLFSFVKRLYGDRVALWAILFLATFPRFVAHAHYNAKDLPVMVFALLTLYLLYLAHESRKKSLWALAGISFGLSINAKLDALLIVPVFVAAWAIERIRNQATSWSVQQAVVNGGTFVYFGCATVFLLWPLLWIDPLLLFKAVKHFSGAFNPLFLVSYLGEIYPIDEMPWHYMGLHLLAVTPLPVLFFMAIGFTVFGKTVLIRERVFIHALLVFWLALPLLIRMYPGALQYDGMRHVFLVVPALMILAAIGFDHALSVIRDWRSGALLSSGLIVLTALWLAGQNALAHPYQGSYLNEVVRLALAPGKRGDWFDLHSWGTPLHHGVRWLNEQAPPNARIYIPNQRPLLRQYALRPDLIVTDSEPADWVMVPSWRKDIAQRFGQEPEFAVRCQGADLLLIHRLSRAD